MLLLAVVAGIAILLLWASSVQDKENTKSFLQAVGTGLLVSAAFGAAQSLITGHITFDLLRQSVSDQVERIRADFVTDVHNIVATGNLRFMPISVFRGTKEPDPEFNRTLNGDLVATSVFWFRGVSARYTASRLVATPNGNLEVRAILPDLGDNHSLDARADYLIRNELEVGKTKDEVVAKIRNDVAIGLMGLFQARHHCGSIELILTANPILDRVELFRETVWVTLFSSITAGTKFPETLRFSKQSIMYAMHEAECQQLRQSASLRTFRLTGRTTDAHFADIYQEITGAELTAEMRTNLINSFNEFKNQNSSKITP